MNMRLLPLTGIAILVLILSTGSHANLFNFFDKNEQETVEATIVTWDDLIPDDFVQPENPFATMPQEEIDILLDGSDESKARLKKLQDDFDYAPVVDELDGTRVKIAAYITPLEFDGQTKMSEFLLVPYVGACMHTPPPPANQVVHANSPTAIELKSVYEPVWAIGTIRTESVKSDLAESGYKLEVEEVRPYRR